MGQHDRARMAQLLWPVLPEQLRPLLRRINAYILRWARKKYKRLRSFKKALAWWKRVVQREPGLFAHWEWTTEFWMTG